MFLIFYIVVLLLYPMKILRTLLVEDDPIYMIKMELMLESLGFKNIKTAATAEEAILHIGDYKPALIISDLFLGGEKTGLDLMKIGFAEGIPILLITACQEDGFFIEAKKRGNVAYLVKPFHKITLESTIDLMLSYHSPDVSADKILYIRGYHNEKTRVNYNDILWCQVNKNYSTIMTKTAKYVLKQSLQKTINELDDERFIRIHDAYAVNIDHITTIFADFLEINGQNLPLGRTYKKQLTQHVRIFKNS